MQRMCDHCLFRDHMKGRSVMWDQLWRTLCVWKHWIYPIMPSSLWRLLNSINTFVCYDCSGSWIIIQDALRNFIKYIAEFGPIWYCIIILKDSTWMFNLTTFNSFSEFWGVLFFQVYFWTNLFFVKTMFWCVGDWASGVAWESKSVLQQTGVSTGRLFTSQTAESEGFGSEVESCGQETPSLSLVLHSRYHQTPQTGYIVSLRLCCVGVMCYWCFFISFKDDCPVRDRERKAALLHFSSENNLDQIHKKQVLTQEANCRWRQTVALCLADLTTGILQVYFQISLFHRSSELRIKAVERMMKTISLLEGNEETALNEVYKHQTLSPEISQGKQHTRLQDMNTLSHFLPK